MALVPARKRTAELRRLGFSDGFVRLVAGKLSHPLLEQFIFSPADEHPTYDAAADGDDGYPQAARLLPLWEHWESTLVGVWERDGSVEVIEYEDGEPRSRVVARTEQGALAYVLQVARDQRDLDFELPGEEFEVLAATIGFRHLGELRQALRAVRAHKLRFHEDYRDAATAVIDQFR
jgi:hypothetical protein